MLTTHRSPEAEVSLLDRHKLRNGSEFELPRHSSVVQLTTAPTTDGANVR